ncbi:MAG: YbfB/YjiJ family MFS transporter [Parvibaculaceae bacterium]|nr:YbfB/YjiJ family MFS transporter [Parvibaculaceae bacterium]
MTPVSSQRPASPLAIALVGTIALAVAMGIGRFAFTPLLPMMLHDGTLDLHFGSWLATANYAGYLIGAMLCMALPRHLPGTILIKGGLAATIVLTLGMVLPVPLLWPALRFLAGMASAMVFVFTSGWCLAQFARLGMPARGAVIFTGPGIGIALSGLAASAMVAAHWTATSGWLVFGLLSALLSALVWTGLSEPDAPPPVSSPAPAGTPAPLATTGSSLEMGIFTVAYGLAGFGYIITATFLPVIAREALPDSLWLDLFWPILGLGVVAGALLSTLVPARIDPRLVLTGCYLFQAVGVVLGLLLPSLTGFIAGSVLMGLPFTAITFFAMQEVRRLRPYHAARFMGLLTAFYGLGQIAGPPLAAFLLAHSASRGTGFALSLGIASATLVTGAALYVVMSIAWPRAR